MTEQEAETWIRDRFGEDAHAKLADFLALLLEEMPKQNLIAPSTVTSIWARHIVDSAQLLLHAPPTSSSKWLDIGSGAGFPGLVIAILSDYEVTLVEPRRRRADFLEKCTRALGLGQGVTIAARDVKNVSVTTEVISARAVAPLDQLFDLAWSCSSTNTLWIFPKGRSAVDEVASAQKAWHGVFHVERSVTDPTSWIVVATGVQRR